MSKMHAKMYLVGLCTVSVLLFTSCGEAEDDSRRMADADGNSAEVTSESIPFTIIKEETEGAGGAIETIGETQLLVAIDKSGSMELSENIIKDTTEMISSLIKKELPTSAVEYMLFNADGCEFVSADALFPINYGGETSIYLGMEQINTWVEEHVRDNSERGIRTALILFSDLYSSRTKSNCCYEKITAEDEQNDIDTWTESWNVWIEEGSLDVCVIQWESMADGEDSSRTLEKELEPYSKGFQVELSCPENNILQLGNVKLDRDHQNMQTERRVVGSCLERVLEVITGVSGQTWGDEKHIIKWDNNKVTFNTDKVCMLFIRIDSDKLDREQTNIIFLESEDKYTVEQIFQGEVTNVYMVENVPVDKLEIQVADANSQHVYCLTIPQIKMEAKFENHEGRIEVGEEITINITAKCKDRDIRWKDTELPLKISITIKDMDDSSHEDNEDFCVHPGDKFVLVPGSAGNYKVILSYMDSEGEWQEIGRTVLNIK